MFSNLIFEPDPSTGQTGTFTDIDGVDQTFSGLRIDTVLFQVAQSKNIVKTAVQGSTGRSKNIQATAISKSTSPDQVVGENPNEYPETDVQTLIKVLSIPETIGNRRNFWDFSGSQPWSSNHSRSNKTPDSETFNHLRSECLSDRPIELT